MRPLTSAEWVEYFSANRAAWDAIPWDADPGVTRDEIAPILRSIQAWQLGETSDGRHLRAAAQRYSDATGDADFTVAVEYFIYEEQTHGEALGRFLDAIGAPRIHRNWGDTLFRLVRYALPSMESWTTVVIMIETMALLFYESLRRATPSPLLRAVCAQILRDEVPHLRFQYERLGAMHARRPTGLMGLTMLGHRLLFGCVATAVWIDHHRLFRAGGHTFGSYWSQAWRAMHEHWRRMRCVALDEAAIAKAPPAETPSRLGGWLH